jgi:hypothetical protein
MWEQVWERFLRLLLLFIKINVISRGSGGDEGIRTLERVTPLLP